MLYQGSWSLSLALNQLNLTQAERKIELNKIKRDQKLAFEIGNGCAFLANMTPTGLPSSDISFPMIGYTKTRIGQFFEEIKNLLKVNTNKGKCKNL